MWWPQIKINQKIISFISTATHFTITTGTYIKNLNSENERQ